MGWLRLFIAPFLVVGIKSKDDGYILKCPQEKAHIDGAPQIRMFFYGIINDALIEIMCSFTKYAQLKSFYNESVGKDYIATVAFGEDGYMRCREIYRSKADLEEFHIYITQTKDDIPYCQPFVVGPVPSFLELRIFSADQAAEAMEIIDEVVVYSLTTRHGHMQFDLPLDNLNSSKNMDRAAELVVKLVTQAQTRSSLDMERNKEYRDSYTAPDVMRIAESYSINTVVTVLMIPTIVYGIVIACYLMVDKKPRTKAYGYVLETQMNSRAEETTVEPVSGGNGFDYPTKTSLPETAFSKENLDIDTARDLDRQKERTRTENSLMPMTPLILPPVLSRQAKTLEQESSTQPSYATLRRNSLDKTQSYYTFASPRSTQPDCSGREANKRSEVLLLETAEQDGENPPTS